LAWAKTLARTGAVTAALDSSDGFWRSVKILARSSGVGVRARAEALPVSSALRRWAGSRAADFALVGGEDYELVFTVRPDAVRRVEALGWARAVGDVLPARQGVTVLDNGVAREVPSGFEHFDR
jgi:thiamine-monophosphate kinase